MSNNRVVIFSLHDQSAAFIKGILSSFGCEVTTCDRTEQTIALCREQNPSLVIILNHTLPINGSELIRSIRPNTQRTPAIYVISWQQNEQVVLSLLEMGIDQYMTFPICIHRLRTKVAETLKIELS
ncbi:MAG: response regulator [Alistipes sp.]|nr:response regulator [Alistipes sp.]